MITIAGEFSSVTFSKWGPLNVIILNQLLLISDYIDIQSEKDGFQIAYILILENDFYYKFKGLFSKS
jgi:hypothetical protein